MRPFGYITIIISLVGLLLYQSLFAMDVRNVRDFQSSYLNFLKDAAVATCMDKDAIMNIAAQRNWVVQDPDPLRPMNSEEVAWESSIRVFR